MIYLHVPKLDELWYRQKLLSDAETMSYNKGCNLGFDGYDNNTGCIDFFENKWQSWFDYFIGNEPERYYAYIVRKEDNAFIGEVNLHKSENADWYDMGIVLEARYRGKGYAVEALKLLLNYAFHSLGAKAVHNDFEETRIAAVKTHLSAGFTEYAKHDGIIELVITREKYITSVLFEEYSHNPCRILSIPYWKYRIIQTPEDTLILHNDDFSDAFLIRYNDNTYFRLYHKLDDIRQAVLPDNYVFENIGIADVKAITVHINECYNNISVSEDDINGFINNPYYPPELRILLYDNETKDIVATGIAACDSATGEASLEWIQVSPLYRNKGFGQAVVNELLKRIKRKAKYATVSGQTDNYTNPQKLYRRCGFTGNDVWHILKSKGV
ncbi:MAG: GNAT family N-acetyltransferase [Eubacteriales bacterium]|nr:GNAT family N-acetyltransferase [Eubacteriales bacterium]